MKLLSVVVPCYNEGTLLNESFAQIKDVLQKVKQEKQCDYEVIFVNDGSKDETLKIIQEIAEKEKCLKYISFSRNFGKEAAMLAGLEKTKGEAVIIMDADLQHPPSLIVDLLQGYEEGYDQVIAKRDRKGEDFTRKMLSKLYYKIVNNVMDVEMIDGVGDFRLLSRKAVDAILSMPEYNRFSKGIFSWIGYDKKTIQYQNNERVSGDSKWGFKGLLNYAVEGVVSFNSSPLRMIIYLGMLVTCLSVIYISYSLIQIIAFGIDMPGYFTIISAILMLGGIQMISLGIIGEYVGRIFYEVKRRPKYIVNETNTGDE